MACLTVAVVWAWRANAERGPDAIARPVAKTSTVLTAGEEVGAAGNVVQADHATSAAESEVVLRPTSTEPAAGSDEAYRQLILGEWEDEYYGKRHLTVKSDGTGTMTVEPSGIGKALFAAKLVFQIEWTIQDGVVSLKTLGGEPKAKANLVLKMYGDKAVYPVIELTESRLHLQDSDGKTRYDWRRPGELPVATDEE